jgi:hypothetical protein
MKGTAWQPFLLLLTAILLMPMRGFAQRGEDTLLAGIINRDPLLRSFADRKDELRIQIIYTQIDRNKNQKPIFTEHDFNLDSNLYFYPASTVKLPIAILALQKLHELNIAGLDRNTTMITGADGFRQSPVWNDPSSPDGRPTIANYIKKILLVSDNDAFNRLYEFLGQEYINNTLHKMGYDEVQIIHRLNISLSEEENRHTNAIQFYDNTGKVLFDQSTRLSELIYAQRNTKLGAGYMRGNEIVKEPFDFSKKNRMYLSTLHDIVRSIMFPGAVPPSQRFQLTEDDYAFLRRYMSMFPPESISPVYDSVDSPPTFIKFLFYGGSKEAPVPGIRIFSKPGDAYGFMIDGTYFVDFNHSIEFLLSATIYSNSDQVFNDDHYDYETVGKPFMRELGRAVYEYELTRHRKYLPDLRALQFVYDN